MALVCIWSYSAWSDLPAEHIGRRSMIRSVERMGFMGVGEAPPRVPDGGQQAPELACVN